MTPGLGGKNNLMDLLKHIFLTIANLCREAWRVPRAMASAVKERWVQNRQEVSEAERLDRIRQPWKYLGKS
jgi:hypothetical protein